MTKSGKPQDAFASLFERKKKQFTIGLALIFLIAAWGIAIPRSQVLDPLPWVFWFLTIFIFLTHGEKQSIFIFKFLLLIIAGWAIEVMGVQGGILFGKYGYGHLFGPTIIHVPVICGAIWLINTLTMMQLTRYYFNIQGYWKTALVAALLMTAMDAFAQLPAFISGFWSYKDLSYPPYYHSIGYFGIAFLTCTLGGDDFTNVRNRGALTLAFIQPIFLIVLYILLLIFR